MNDIVSYDFTVEVFGYLTIALSLLGCIHSKWRVAAFIVLIGTLNALAFKYLDILSEIPGNGTYGFWAAIDCGTILFLLHFARKRVCLQALGMMSPAIFFGAPLLIMVALNMFMHISIQTEYYSVIWKNYQQIYVYLQMLQILIMATPVFDLFNKQHDRGLYE